jgi:phosphohistidine phosphatase SixA
VNLAPQKRFGLNFACICSKQFDMKNTLITCFFIVGLIVGCKKEDPIIPLEVTGFDKKTVILMPSSRWTLKVNQRATIKTSAGSATQDMADSLVYTAPSTVGNYRITVKSERNQQDSLVIKVAVTPRANVLRPLQKGGYVLVFRHAAADVGADQLGSTTPEWWKSCDSKLARQLNATGRQESIDIGQTLRNLQIPVGRVISSEYCRCFTTADLMNMGVPTQQSKDLTYYVYEEAKRYANTMQVAQNQPIDNQNSLLVIHAGFEGTLPTPAPLATLNWSDAAVFQLVQGQAPRYIATVLVKEWRDLAK